MSIPVIAFFNNKGGVGKTSLVYHMAWMFWDLQLNVIAADLDPQSNLSAAFLEESRLERMLSESHKNLTIFDAVRPLKEELATSGHATLKTLKIAWVCLWAIWRWPRWRTIFRRRGQCACRAMLGHSA